MTSDVRAMGAYIRVRREARAPQAVGLPAGRRRVPGLRREELATLANLSIQYLTRLERGQHEPSAEVLHALSEALGLTGPARDRLYQLAGRSAPEASWGPRDASATLRRLVDRAMPNPAFLLDRHFDVLGHNLALELCVGDSVELSRPRPNAARFVFCDPVARRLWPDWEVAAADTAAHLRHQLPKGSNLPVSLGLSSAEFAGLWARQDARCTCTPTVRLCTNVAGELDFVTETLVAGSGEVRLIVWEPATAAAELTWAKALGQRPAIGLHAV